MPTLPVMAYSSSAADDPAAETNVADRRQHVRHPAESYVRAVHRASARVLGELEDISLGGFKLQVHDAVQRGGTCELELHICVEAHRFPPIAVTARNVWVHGLAFDGIQRAGFVFINLDPAAREQIEAFFSALGGQA